MSSAQWLPCRRAERMSRTCRALHCLDQDDLKGCLRICAFSSESKSRGVVSFRAVVERAVLYASACAKSCSFFLLAGFEGRGKRGINSGRKEVLKYIYLFQSCSEAEGWTLMKETGDSLETWLVSVLVHHAELAGCLHTWQHVCFESSAQGRHVKLLLIHSGAALCDCVLIFWINTFQHEFVVILTETETFYHLKCSNCKLIL